MLNPNNTAITFENFLENEAYNPVEKSKLRQLFKPYLQEGAYGNWSLINSPQLISNGVFIMVNNSTGMVDFVSLVETAVTDQAPMTNKAN